MDHTELELNSFNDFLAWKAEIENNTKSKFISYSTKHINIHGVKYYYFRCHRSGNFMSESKSLRHLKILGSNKINAYCPAALKVTEHTDGKCIVSYQKVHVGHQNDLGHLFLTRDERKNIASKIAAKIPLDNILDEIRNSISDAGLERVHLLTKKDLHTIEKSFNLSSNSVKHENDGVSVDMWVREMQNSENPCILFYKTQGSTCTQYSFLKENDFVLIIMTEAQGEILKKFSSDCICIDSTHGVNGYGFELTTTTPEITPSAPGPALDMETSTTMDTNAPSGESLESCLESVRVDALRANLSSIQNSSDYLSIAIFAENKLNCLSNFMFPDINVSNNISVDLIKIIEEARLKFSILKHQEMKDDLNQFTNLCQSWGIQNPATQTPFVLAKPRQRKNSLPGETSKKQKLEATTCQNKFSVLYIEDPPEELQIDEPLPPSPTPEKTTTKPKKKHGPSKKPTSLANKQPPAPTPVITAAQIAQPSAVWSVDVGYP
ncbi:uncharacterized protein NPIL_585391 [Nephila pilipes]|uniref:Uncharacterized protein n=1 Tax=Nephila pilipes TaxID=299642 RepID=A0A8X6T4B8_NEPPI|nr:uncharacterized protein NPIL_585391 [Nephila pilipes]